MVKSAACATGTSNTGHGSSRWPTATPAPPRPTANTFIKWNHHIGSIVNALPAAGLRIEFLHEYDFTDVPFHGLERGKDGLSRIPADRFQIP